MRDWLAMGVRTRTGYGGGSVRRGGGYPGHLSDADLLPLDELIRQTPGVHPISSLDELRSEAFGTDAELEEFLAFVAASRRADLA